VAADLVAQAALPATGHRVSQAPTGGLRRSIGSMAAGTAVSRATGVLRILVLAYVLGITPLADAYNLANTIPNMLYDVVLGGILGATFIPVFIERLATKTEREAWRSISAVVTMAVTVLAVSSVLVFAAAPWIIDAFTIYTHHTAHNPHQLATQRAVSTTLLRWFVPQIFLYGLLSIGAALLNIRRKFGAPMWVPVANNVVVIIVLLLFAAVAPHPTLHSVSLSPGQLALLGAGTTAGVLVQAILLTPALARAQLGRLRWRFDIHDEAVRAVGRLGSWTFGFVILNQIALYVVVALAFGSGGAGPLSSYTYAYAFMLMPYAVVTVSVMTAVTPDLSHHHTTGDRHAFVARFGSGLRAMLAIIIPSAVAMFVLARPLIAVLLGHGHSSPAQTLQTGTALAELSLGLVGFTVFQYVVRALQARQEARTAFWLYLAENAINVVVALILVHPLGLAGVMLSISIAYDVAAVAGLLVLLNRLGHLGTPGCFQPLWRVLAASGVMGVVVLVISNLSGALSGPALYARVLASLILGGGAYLGTAALLGRRSVTKRASLQD
jgi:putative peptidoglycan lipid II flippase